jgi:hypothetical protein
MSLKNLVLLIVYAHKSLGEQDRDYGEDLYVFKGCEIDLLYCPKVPHVQEQMLKITENQRDRVLQFYSATADKLGAEHQIAISWKPP